MPEPWRLPEAGAPRQRRNKPGVPRMRSRSSIVLLNKENQGNSLSNKTLLIAYPSEPEIIGSTISALVEKSRRYTPGRSITAWPELDVPGHFISSEVLASISTTDILIADISVLNFNVTYEIGYAIGRKKRLLLIRQESIEGGLTEVKELGVFDTIGWATYASSDDLLSILSRDLPPNPIAFNNEQIRKKTPIYYLDTQFKTDPIVLLKSRLKKTKIPFVSFDPQETRRLSGYEVVFDVAGSTGVIVPLITQLEKESRLHNLRAAFVAGLGAGMEKEVLILQLGDDPVPIDYRDFVTMAKYPDQIIGALAEFAPRVTDRLFTGVEVARTSGDSILKKIQLGATRAENEDRDLRAYYVETNAFVRTQRGDIRLVLGRKGSGKTALLMQLRDRLLENRDNVVVDLMPEGYQFVKFREDVLRYMQEGTYEHTIIAFWEYALLLEVTYKILETDKALHITNHNLFKPYQQLRKVYRADEYDREGDFSEHVGKLMDSFRQNFHNRYKTRVISAYPRPS